MLCEAELESHDPRGYWPLSKKAAAARKQQMITRGVQELPAARRCIRHSRNETICTIEQQN
jgi:hypothetical protein